MQMCLKTSALTSGAYVHCVNLWALVDTLKKIVRKWRNLCGTEKSSQLRSGVGKLLNKGQLVCFLALCAILLTLLFHCKSSHRRYINRWACLCAQTSFTKEAGDWMWAAGHSLPTPALGHQQKIALPPSIFWFCNILRGRFKCSKYKMSLTSYWLIFTKQKCQQFTFLCLKFSKNSHRPSLFIYLGICCSSCLEGPFSHFFTSGHLLFVLHNSAGAPLGLRSLP